MRGTEAAERGWSEIPYLKFCQNFTGATLSPEYIAPALALAEGSQPKARTRLLTDDRSPRPILHIERLRKLCPFETTILNPSSREPI
jgi:hypothetical protein